MIMSKLYKGFIETKGKASIEKLKNRTTWKTYDEVKNLNGFGGVLADDTSGVEIRLRNLGEKLNLHKVHPHKFRRTLATTAIDKGMPIEQVQQLLGHQSIDTTLQYAMVNQNNVKQSHRKFIV